MSEHNNREVKNYMLSIDDVKDDTKDVADDLSYDPSEEFFAERVSILGVPCDIVPNDDLQKVIYQLLKKKEHSNIVLLSLWDLLRARSNTEYRNYVQNASLIIPISKSIVSGAHFLTGKTLVRYMPFNFIVQLLTILEKREYSMYLLGGKSVVLTKTEKNIRQTFPKLRIIGRYPGNIKKQDEDTLLTVIRKSSPSLLLVGQGVHGREKWLAKNDARLNTALRLWCSDIFEVFSERRRRPSSAIFNRGLEWIGFSFQKPLRFFRVFPFIFYNILLVLNKLKRSNKSSNQGEQTHTAQADSTIEAEKNN
ncbi:MAG: WecB/TagA/CpsF family glycosyltransferase [Termitinemataceae bacterium]|nr:MAG: WecB/TagA/CpsF family glycosyltransferase [Termitinemataceae bacterium]